MRRRANRIPNRPRQKQGCGVRSGLSLVEVLVALSLIAIVLAIAVVAVQSARGASHRVACQNNLRQILLAATQHHQTAGHYFCLNPKSPCTDHKYTNAFTQWLPEMGHRAVFDTILPCRFAMAPIPRPRYEFGNPLAVFLCPADSVPEGLNYRLNFGSVANSEPLVQSRRNSETANGPFGWSGCYDFSQITDGLSYTIGISEKRKSPGWGMVTESHKISFDRDRHTWDIGIDVANDPAALMSLCRSAPATPLAFEWRCGDRWSGHETVNAYYNHLAPPNWRGTDCSTVNDRVGLWRATSNHRGGVNTARMDGAIHFAADEIDLTLWQALATRAGDERIADR